MVGGKGIVVKEINIFFIFLQFIVKIKYWLSNLKYSKRYKKDYGCCVIGIILFNMGY